MSSPRHAVVLIAGTGSRLRPLTDKTPKCLLSLGATTLLDRLLRQLSEAGVSDVLLITGHLHELVAAAVSKHSYSLSIQLIYNRAYDTSNNAVSLFLAKQALSGADFYLCDGDVLLAKNAFQQLAACEVPSALLVDASVALAHEEMKVVVDAEGFVRELSKELAPSRCLGESIGIQKVGGAAASMIWQELEEMFQQGRRNAYYEEAFQRMVDKGQPFATVLVEPGSWTEIDDLADLEDARARFGNT
jgi:choline kinase